jgi:CheY-like chemotaxis protein
MLARVLFVDDEPSIRQTFAEILKLEGLTVTTCATAEEACRRLVADPFDLVITDMRMENPTAGWRVVRAAQRLPHPPSLIVLTAFPIPASDRRHYHIDGVLTKGVNAISLIAKLRELIQKVIPNPAKGLGENEGGHFFRR